MAGTIRSDIEKPVDLSLAADDADLCAGSDLRKLPSWPPRPATFGNLMTPVEAAQYLRLDETGQHTPRSAIRTLNYWRDRGQLKATKFARRVWFRKAALDEFLAKKTEA
ncbi:MAG: helix-turn-helix domain-containing protein [Planctomycetota bacterium]